MRLANKLRDMLLFFGTEARMTRRHAPNYKPAWTTERYGCDVVFFDRAWALQWYEAHANECSTALDEQDFPTHSLKRLDDKESFFIKRLHDKQEHIARKMKRRSSEFLAYHALNFAFATNDTALAEQVAHWVRQYPQRWFHPQTMANYYHDEMDGDYEDPGKEWCLFARLFEAIHVLEWFFDHAPDIKASLQVPSTWKSLVQALEPCDPNDPCGESKSFHLWPLVSNQCFGLSISPLMPGRTAMAGYEFRTIFQGQAHHPVAQCYYLLRFLDWFDSFKHLPLAPLAKEFGNALLTKGPCTPAISTLAKDLVLLYQLGYREQEFYAMATERCDPSPRFETSVLHVDYNDF